MIPTLALLLAVAADPDPPVVPAEPRYELQFEDGSVVIATLPDAGVGIVTRFGTLTVPFADIKKVRIGFRYPEGVEAKVRRAVDDLGSPDHAEREAAQKALLALGEYALPRVRAGATSDVPEVARRCEAILAKLLTTLSDDQIDRPEADEIVTAEMTLRGKLAAGDFKANTKHFGAVAVKVADLKGVRPLGGAKSEGVFTVAAAKHAAPKWRTFFDTGLDVEKGQPFEVKAAGKIDQNPDQPGKATCGPEGNSSWQVAGPQGGGGERRLPGGLGGPRAVDELPSPPACTSGALYGRIGPSGPLFKIGERHKEPKAATGGRLYLVIAPTPASVPCVGEFEVKVRLGK